MSEEIHNPFTLFSLPHSLPVDQQVLKKRYFELQRDSHPDQRKDSEAQSISSSLINKYYVELRKVSNAARYLLELHEVDVNSAQQDPEMLMEIMDLEERFSDGSAEDVLRDLDQKIFDNINILNTLIQSNKEQKIDQEKASKTWQKLRFIDQLKERYT
tara:strand:+ start:28671 stop:29144 length:474 start_codon:yes stop_codon:yes gene_type:complete